MINEILRYGNVSSRAEVMKYLLTCGFLSIETMNNFDFCVVIQTVLECTPIYRLKQSWEKVEKIIPKKRAEFKKLLGVGGSDIHHIMKNSVPPLVPFIGIIMKWVINNHEIPSTIEQSTVSTSSSASSSTSVMTSSTPSLTHLNINKYRLLANTINMFENGQKIPYTIDNDLKIQKIVLQPVQWNDEESMQMRSVELEAPINNIK